MQQKDYKAISEMIRSNLTADRSRIDVELVNELSEYFEKEDDKINQEVLNRKPHMKVIVNKYKEFNRQQFLKMCGVK